jgi:Na+/glutamate symporter
MQWRRGMSVIQLSPLASITTGFQVLLIGKRLNRKWGALQRYQISEPVSGQAGVPSDGT